jgi:hypothetical protein
MEYSGAGGKLICEKNQKQKSRDTVPLMGQSREIFCFRFSPKPPDNINSGISIFFANSHRYPQVKVQ